MRYAVVTDHPNKQPRRLLVRSWHETEEDADEASVALVMEFSRPVKGRQVIDGQLSGLAIVPENLLVEVAPGVWGWAKDAR
jgi:hypothetical protein